MIRCLFVFADMPLSANWSGGASRIAMPPEALRRLGVDVHVLRFLEDRERETILQFEEDHPDEAPSAYGFASWTDLGYRRPQAEEQRLHRAIRAMFDPIAARFPEAAALAEALRSHANDVRPDLVWAGWVPAEPAVHMARLGIPWVAVHTDWVHELIPIRNPAVGSLERLRQRWHSVCAKRADLAFLRSAAAIETGSTVQASQMRSFGLSNVHVIPQAFEFREADLALPDGALRIVHFGSLETTSNRVGLSAYLDRAHHETVLLLRADGNEAELWIVGDSSTAKPDLRAKLQAAGAICAGYVHDLGTVLRPFDIQIIPYEQATGLRSKAAQLFGHAQVLVAARAAVSGMPELVHGENCILVDRVEEFPAAIRQLASSPAARMRIGIAARETVDRRFRLDALLPRYEALLNSALRAPDRRVPGRTQEPIRASRSEPLKDATPPLAGEG